MIESVFELDDTLVREMMVPSIAMIWIESDMSATQVTTLAVRSGHSHIPVIGENVYNIVGVFYLRDLVQHTFFFPDHGRGTVVAQVMLPAVFGSGLQAVGHVAA
uniref:B1937_F1_22 n=1 Tax=Mycobacterium leprae TaxID=1769 RepID=Q49753_MYCLR|nr:B1937_F1_22 [Mycobacterium leprae]